MACIESTAALLNDTPDATRIEDDGDDDDAKLAKSIRGGTDVLPVRVLLAKTLAIVHDDRSCAFINAQAIGTSSMKHCTSSSK